MNVEEKVQKFEDEWNRIEGLPSTGTFVVRMVPEDGTNRCRWQFAGGRRCRMLSQPIGGLCAYHAGRRRRGK